jgi:hypothetical protein
MLGCTSFTTLQILEYESGGRRRIEVIFEMRAMMVSASFLREELGRRPR